MNRKNIVYIALIGLSVMLFVRESTAQNEVDTLRYSTMYHGGTARFIGVGGAFSALGSDISSANQNPAGLGLYRSSDINFTTTFDNTKTTTNYLGQSNFDHSYSIEASSVGMAFSLPNTQNYGSGKGTLNTVIAINFSQVNNYNSNLYALGRNNNNSYLTNLSDYYNQNPSYLDLFWDAGILYEDNGTVVNDFDVSGEYQIKQQFEHRQRGTLNDLNFSIGVNESNKLYYGLSVGLVSLYHTEDWVLQENDDKEVTQYLNAYNYNNYFVRSGMGVNFKAGIMYQLNSRIKTSFAIHTPTFMTIDEDWDEKLHTSFDSSQFDSKLASYFTTTYNLVTPTRFLVGASFLINRMIILGIDYETSAYNTMRLDSETYSFSEENSRIKNDFTFRHAVRIGSEVKLGALALRVGGFYYTTPFKSAGTDNAVLGLSGGFGFRSGNFYTDLAYQNTMSSSFYRIDGTDAMSVEVDQTKHRFYLTFGLRF